MTDNTKLVGRLFKEKVPIEDISQCLGNQTVARGDIGRLSLSLRQLGRFCDYFKCQPWDLIEFRETSDCVEFLSHKNRDFSKLWKIRDEMGSMPFSRVTGIAPALCYGCNDKLSLTSICGAAYGLGLRIPDLVDYKE